jgi:hypothetical protein
MAPGSVTPYIKMNSEDDYSKFVVKKPAGDDDTTV